MARRILDKYTKPAPEPEPQPQPTQPSPAPGVATPAKPAEKPFESERLMLFGPPRTQKTIAMVSGIGLVFTAIVYAILSKDVKPFPLAGLIFVAIHGALLGMLLSQLILVYPDRNIIIFTLMAVVVGESIYGGVIWSKLPEFVFNRQRFQEILAIFFWAGFVGFWVGYAFYAKRQSDRKKFVQRYSSGGGPNS